MNILAFDTSNQPLSVAIIANNEILTEQTINIKRNHSIQLMPAINEAFKQTNLFLKDMDKIAVASGPGSYTGLRIAVTTAKSLAWSLDIDLVGVSSLRVLAENSSQRKDELIVPIFDARRENIYTGLYTRNDEGKLVQLVEDTHISAEKWANLLSAKNTKESIELIGSDAAKFIDTFKEKLADRVKLAPHAHNLPRASELAFLAQNEKVVPTHTLVPTYLKLAEAEENWMEEHPDFKGGDLVEKI